MSEKTYEPEVIVENPFPGEVIEGAGQTTKSGGTYQPTTTGVKTFKRKKIATEVLSTALNTHSRKILGEFEFTEQGAIQVGKYQNGVSGDLRISPNGITARDTAGLTTFNLDGTDGSATFKGTIQAGSLVSGEVVVSDSGSFNLESGADIILNSSADDESKIIFTQEQEENPIAYMYFDYNNSEMVFKKPVGSPDFSFNYGSGTLPLQSFNVFGLDGFSTRSYSADLTHCYKVEFTPSSVRGYYDDVSIFKFDTSGNLFIKGTLTDNWVP